jgi:hypothetical protein
VRRLSVFFILTAALLTAANLRVIVRDPKGALVPGAEIGIRNAAGIMAVSAVTGPIGSLEAPKLEKGQYTIDVNKEGFEPATRTVLVEDKDLEITIDLKLAVVETAIEVAGKRSRLANADPNYVALRSAAPTSHYRVSNLKLTRDVGTLTLQEGAVSLLAPVLGKTVIAVFRGSGSFHLKPAMELERRHLNTVIDSDTVDEDFDSAIFTFSDSTADEIKTHAQPSDDAGGTDVLKQFRSHMRRRVTIPRSFTEAMFFTGDVPNVEAELLADLYNPSRAGAFRAFIHGRKHSDLRFFVKPRGAIPGMSPEEVAVISVEPMGKTDGIWYLTHYASEWENSTASSDEVKSTIVPEHYRIETIIGKNRHLTAVADVTVRALESGERVIPFGLLQTLRVTRVSGGNNEIPYIQEGRKEDGSFYVVLPEPAVKDKSYTLKIEYEGDRVIEDWGEGNFAVGARESWYPSMNAFQQQATYELVFKVPRKLTLVGVGKLAREEREDDFAVTEWKTNTPIAVAGFNYGDFKRKQVKDEVAKYQIEAYATTGVPDMLRGAAQQLSLTPSAMADSALAIAQNSIRLFNYWFGEAPYGRIAITQQPQFNFGQSWPTLVYLPISAFFDETQRWELMGEHAFRFGHFIQEVTPHEISHQWWGHMVGWSSYHDQWLSEGFADFSAGLYLQATEKKPDKYRQYWERGRKAILEKNEFGRSANDAGPLWMGLRLNCEKNPGAYNRLVYPKGGYFLHMLRSLMWDPKTGDQDFIAMMHDFVQSNLYKAASSEKFQATVQKHMKPAMDAEGNGSIGWFFREWLFGTAIPKYSFEYSVKQDGGSWLLSGKLTQGDVPDNFVMRVPIYVEFDNGLIRLGSARIRGNMTGEVLKDLKLPKRPKRVLINANHDVLASESISKEM